ncbi:hypothetical protein B5C26_02365, partial [Photorhabdus luminescens]|uniref:VENN motif pre-toxin domain-containing protein n=1 Tax=Photorhabdus luminescens TaxID=29488 RepID=UPI000B4C2F0C
GELSAQMTEIAGTEGKIIATKTAKEKLDHISEQDKADAREKLINAGNQHPTSADINQQIYDTAYTQALNDSGLGTGGKYQKALQAATAAIQGLAGNNLGQALAGGASPYLAGVIKDLTTDPQTHQVDIVTNTLAHAILGAVAAEVSGNNALSGAAGAASGELAAQVLIKQLYGDGAKVSELTEEQKQTVSTLSTLAAGLAGGIAGDSSASALTGAQAGKNAVDNNHLSVDQNRSRSEELVNCQGDSSCRATVRDKYRQEYDRVQERIATCSGADQCVAVAKELRALQGDYSARMSEIQEKARMQGLDSLTPAEVREWADLRGAMSNIDASRNLVLHRAQVTGGSEETTQEIVKIMGQTGIAASAGVAGGIGKAGAKGVKGGAIPVPNPVTANNGLVYKSNPKHTLGGDGNRLSAGIEPQNSFNLFEKSIPTKDPKVRLAIDEKGNIHRFFNERKDGSGSFHWSGSTGDGKNALGHNELRKFNSEIKQLGGKK